MALDQFVAVFYPFKHATLRGTLNKVMLVLFLAVASTVSVMPFVVPTVRLKQGSDRHIYVFLIASVFLMGLLVLLSAYPAVALKLYTQRRSVGPQASRSNTAMRQPSATEATNQTAAQTKTAASKRAMHIQALKIYASIFLAFLIANSILIVAAVLVSPWAAYGYYINHTVNPVIYYCFVEKFRKSVKKYWRRLTCHRFV